MAITYIAFIECVLRPFGHWDKKTGRDIYVPKGKDAEISELNTGKARIAVKIGNENQEHLNLRIRVPYVGDKELLPQEEDENE